MKKPTVYWLWLALAVLAIKLGVLALDHEPMFLIGDSAVYMYSALEGHGVPFDRSIAYGYVFVKSILYSTGSLQSVVIGQSFASAVSALLIAIILRVGFQTRRWIAAGAGLAYACEPLALFYERMMLTECVTLTAFGAFVLAGIIYLQRPRLLLLFLLAAFSTVIVALRISFLPILLASMATLPILCRWKRGTTTAQSWQVYGRFALHFGLSIGVTLAAHAAYKQWFHRVSGEPVAYNIGDGFFLLASWAPLLERQDFPEPSLYDQIVPSLGVEIKNRFARSGQRFSDDGLIEQLMRTQPDLPTANQVARQTAWNIGRRNPLGVLKLGWLTYLDFWNLRMMREGIRVDQGQVELDQELIDIFRSEFHDDLAGHHLLATPTKAWHAASVPWYRLLLLAPLIWLVAALLCRRCWPELLFLGLCTVGLMAVNSLFVTEAVVRYLHSVAWLMITLLALVSDRIAGVRHGPSWLLSA